jgi:hypothetical protein
MNTPATQSSTLFDNVHLSYSVIETDTFAAGRRFGSDANGTHLDDTIARRHAVSARRQRMPVPAAPRAGRGRHCARLATRRPRHVRRNRRPGHPAQRAKNPHQIRGYYNNPIVVDEKTWEPTTYRGINIWGHNPQGRRIIDKLARFKTAAQSLHREDTVSALSGAGIPDG